MEKTTEVLRIENFLEQEGSVDIKSKDFEKIMFIYSVAIK